MRNINLEIREGEFFALLGKNGAGKSTLLSIISSLTKMSQGRITIDGKDLETQQEEVKRVIGVIPQELNLSPFEKVEDVLIHQAGYYGVPVAIARKRAQNLLEQLELADKKNTRVIHLSGGMKRRLLIARALLHHPKILLLDEPTAGLDVQLRRDLWEFLLDLNREDGLTIVLTTHYLEEAERLCEKLALIHLGEIIEHDSIRVLLSRLNTERFIFEWREAHSKESIEKVFQSLPTIHWEFLQDKRVAVRVALDGENLNQIFRALDQVGIIVQRVQQEGNRLEEFFFERVGISGLHSQVEAT